MFDDISDDDLDVHTETSDEPIDDTQLEDQRKPGPLEVDRYMITSSDSYK